MEKSYKELLKNITTFVLDIDGVLTDGTIHITTDGQQLRSMNIKDGFAMREALNQGFNICIISKGTNTGVVKRLQYLEVQDVFIGVDSKMEVLETYMKTHGIQFENILYMGDDIPDYPVMKHCGLPCAPQDAVPEIKAVARYISHRKGGKGCVRDVIEQVMKVQGKWPELE